MITLSRETLILVGIVVLLINIIVAAILRRRLRPLHAIVALLATIAVIVGIFQYSTTPATAASAFSRNAAGSTSSNSTSNNTAATGSASGNTNTTSSTGSNNSASATGNNAGNNAANGNGDNASGRQVPPQIQTEIAQGTVPAPMQTRIAERNATAEANGIANGTPVAPAVVPNSGSGGTTGSNGQNGTSGSSNASAAGNTSTGSGSGSGNTTRTATASPLTALIVVARQYTSLLTVAGGLLVLFAGMIFYSSERERENFRKRGSLGMLHIGIGLVIIAAMLGLPSLTTQATGTTRVAAAVTPTNGPAPTRANLATATPTPNLNPQTTATPLPSLTPTPSETPIVLSTPVHYTNGEVATTVTNCSVSALSGINLRAEPNTNQMAIGKVLAGSLMKVTGKSADEKWWRVISPDNVEGWVSTDYVTAYSGCTADTIPVIAIASK